MTDISQHIGQGFEQYFNSDTHSHDVQVVWDMWPIKWFVPFWVRWAINGVTLPVYFTTSIPLTVWNSVPDSLMLATIFGFGYLFIHM